MSEEPAIDDQSQSHYEISLTAGQAFVAFVLLLLSLAASFAFGLMIGKGQADERLAAKVINRGFTSAYVERGANDKGTIWRVRVKFPSEAEANAALPRLREFSKDIWITH